MGFDGDVDVIKFWLEILLRDLIMEILIFV